MLLGIESSCDESALAIMSMDGFLKGEWVTSQIDKHAEYGGVVPDLAVGEHLNNFIPLLQLANDKHNLSDSVTKIAVTRGPGLVGCLGMGITFAKSLGSLWQVPVYGVNHLHGHAFSVFMPFFSEEGFCWDDFLPHLGLLVSGGNTLLFELDTFLNLNILSETVDDAAGEALDKGAKLLGIPYPGGAKLEIIAQAGDPKAFDFPRVFDNKNELKFSFSGLKTSLLYRLRKLGEIEIEKYKADLAASYQVAVVDQLIRKMKHVVAGRSYKTFGLSGGVANNDLLRKKSEEFCDYYKMKFLPAEKKHTGDNAAMIAFAALVCPSMLVANLDGELTFNPSLRL